jgi:hypothetical protein
MTHVTKKRVSIGVGVTIVLAARLLESQSPFFSLPLFPGGILNLFVSGVHGNWHTPAGEFVTLVPSALFWIISSYAVLSIAEYFGEKKEADPDRQRTTRGK